MNPDNLLSGLIGAILGIAGAFGIQWVESWKDGRAAVRSLFFEMASNGAALSVASKSAVYVPVTSMAWSDTHVRISRTLSPEDLAVVATAYMRITSIIAANYPISGSMSQRVLKVTTEALPRVVMAAEILEKRGWWPWQRAGLKKKLRELLA